MASKESRIFFEGSPYPQGHRILHAEWTARLVPHQGIWFDLHLETDKYYAESPRAYEAEQEETDQEWESRIAWDNYDSCKLSSNYWHQGGFLAGSQATPLDFADLSGSYHADPLPRPANFDHNEDPAFFIYLLGHDDCADHHLHFQKQPDGTYTIDWEGKIARAYVGEYEFDYRFRAQLRGVSFGGLVLPEQLKHKELRLALKQYSKQEMVTEIPWFDTGHPALTPPTNIWQQLGRKLGF